MARQQTPAQKAASDARKGIPRPQTAAMKAGHQARSKALADKKQAGVDRRKAWNDEFDAAARKAGTAAQEAASDERKEATLAQKAASDARRGISTPRTAAQKAGTDKRRAKTDEREAARAEQAAPQVQEYWDEIQRQDLGLLWDDRDVVYDNDNLLPGQEYVLGLRSSSAAQDWIMQVQNGLIGQDVVALRIIQEHNQAQLQLPPHQRTRIRAIWSMMRIGRRSRDRIYNDCGPNGPSRCPIEQEQRLFNTLQHIMQRGNIAVIFQRGLDGLTNSDSLEIFLRY
jgi:hypothetical protein